MSMPIVDFQLHLLRKPSETLLFELNPPGLAEHTQYIQSEMRDEGVDLALCPLFTPELYRLSQELSARELVFAPLADFRSENAISNLAEMASLGIRWISFHPYLQNILTTCWDSAVRYAKAADELGMFINISTAFGSRKLYSVEPLPFATAIVEAVDCPVVFVHGGGAKVLDALLIADAYPNVFLETSFSLSYWLGSTVEQDFAYSIRKLGVDRWLFGSDSPFVPLNKAINDHRVFFDRHKFRDPEVDAIMGQNAIKYLGFS